MPCPTCNHTLQSLGGPYRRWWCPRCGTLTEDIVEGSFRRYDMPTVVQRIRNFVAMIANTSEGRWLRDEMDKMGVLEAVHAPGERREDLETS
jgi:phage FluMu protein Com